MDKLRSIDKKFSYRFYDYLREFLIIQIKKWKRNCIVCIRFFPDTIINETQAISKNFSRRSFFFLTISSSFLLLLTILWGASERKKKKDRSFFFILFLVLLEEEYLRVDTGNIRNEMEISSGGGDKGEVPGDSYRLFPFSTGRKGKKETFLLDRRRYPTWITRITYDFAEFNSNFPGDRRFDLNPRRKFSSFSRPFVHV